MKILVIIRTFPKDDFISYLCYKSFQKVLKDRNVQYLFFAERGNYNWILKTNETILYRNEVANFGGRSGVECCIKWLSKLNYETYDKVIFSDADIILNKDPLEFDYQIGGVQDLTNKRHFSGQLIIYDRWLFEKVLNYQGYENLYNHFLENNISIADDTIMSWVATEYTDKTKNFYEQDYWTHEKLNHLEKDYVE